MIQNTFVLIDHNADLQPNLDQFIQDNNLNKIGKDYNIISILGSQSSGKSTLLNYLFETKFDVLNAGSHRQMTTKGIILSKDKNSNVLVLDVEGSDSVQRWDQRQFFEQSTALFSLALSQVFLINLWTQEIGRFSGSQYGTLRVIFEMNIKLFNQETPKDIIFILRDFSEDENFEAIQDTIRKDLLKIWDELQKPKNFNKMPTDIFKINFFALPHFKFSKQQFVNEVQNLKSYLTNKDDKSYIFKNFDYNNNLPIESLNRYVDNIWDTIKNQKDLNLPCEKQMIASIRCGEILKQSLELVKDMLQQLQLSVKDKINQSFGIQAQKIIQKAKEFYDLESENYQKSIVDEKYLELQQQLYQEIQNIYDLQQKEIKKYCKNKFTEQIQKIDINDEQFYKILTNEMDKLISDIRSILLQSIYNTEKNNIKEIIEDCQQDLNQISQNMINKAIQIFMNKLEREIKKKIQINLAQCFNDVKDNFWDRVNQSYKQHIDDVYILITNQLKNVFNLQQNEIQSYTDVFNNELKLFLEQQIQQKCENLNFYLINKFKQNFCNTSKGVPRNWKSMKQEDIEVIYAEQINSINDLLKIFKYSNINDEEKEVLNELQYTQIQDKLSYEMEKEYKIAIDSLNNKQFSGIPKYIWALLAFFSYDDLLPLLGSWFLYYPLIIFLVFFVTCIAVGETQASLKLVQSLFSQIQHLFNANLLQQGVNRIINR